MKNCSQGEQILLMILTKIYLPPTGSDIFHETLKSGIKNFCLW